MPDISVEPREHRLVRRIEGDFSAELMATALDQDWVGMAPANLVITAVFDLDNKEVRRERSQMCLAGDRPCRPKP